jgi:hypothetical protein
MLLHSASMKTGIRCFARERHSGVQANARARFGIHCPRGASLATAADDDVSLRRSAPRHWSRAIESV